MSFVVKNTTKWGLLDLVCPHTCRGCGRLGAVLCGCCKNDMKMKAEVICPLCKCSVALRAGKCRGCKGGDADGGGNIERHGENNGVDGNGEGVSRSWRCVDCEAPFLWLGVVGWREGALAKLVKDFKYKSVRAAGEVLVELLDARVPENLGAIGGNGGCGEDAIGETGGWAEVVVVPLPTIGRHVRERGLDHTKILAKKLAKRRGWECERVLDRATDTVQVGAKAAERKTQAGTAYEVRAGIDTRKVYLLVDDVWTTGATMLAAEKVLREAGATKIAGVVLTTGRQK